MPSRDPGATLRAVLNAFKPVTQKASPMQGTIGPGKGTSTIAGPVPKGMGKIGAADAPTTVQKNLFGGVPPVSSTMRAKQEPKPPMTTRIASAFPSIEEAMAALRGEDLDPVGRAISKEGRAARIVEAIDLLDVVSGAGGAAEKVAAIARLAEIKKEAQFARWLRSLET
jgi:hypothetical protein